MASRSQYFCSKCPLLDENGVQVMDSNGKPTFGVDCKDWAGLVDHKVQSEKHVCCPVCGLDFQSSDGLQRHVRFSHPKEQKLVCPGCQTIFGRATGLIRHLENDLCKNLENPSKRISRQDFYDQLARKAVVKAIIEKRASDLSGARTAAIVASSQDVSSRTFNASVAKWEDSGITAVDPRRQPNSASVADGEEGGGGVSLFPHITAQEQAKLIQPIKPSSNRAESTTGSQGGVNRSDKIRRRENSIQSRAGSISSSMSDLTVRAAETTDERRHNPTTSKLGGLGANLARPRMMPGAWSELSSVNALFSTKDCSGDGEYTSSTFAMGLASKNAEFDHKYSQPARSRASQGLPASQTMQRSGEPPTTGTNLFHTKFWDPEGAAFSAETFFDSMIEKYTCPFPDCPFSCATPSELSEHMRNNLAIRNFRCPACQKNFNSASAIINHMESSGDRCRIRFSDSYGLYLDRFSGGFLSVKRTKTYRDSDFGDLKEESEDEDCGGDKKKQLVKRLQNTEVTYEAGKPPGFW